MIGGNVSEALKTLSENICYQSMIRIDDSVYTLGKNSLYSIKLIDQVGQLENFIQK